MKPGKRLLVTMLGVALVTAGAVVLQVQKAAAAPAYVVGVNTATDDVEGTTGYWVTSCATGQVVYSSPEDYAQDDIQYALDALPVGGGGIYISNGTYNVAKAGERAPGIYSYAIRVPSHAEVQLADAAVITLAANQDAAIFQNNGWVGGGDAGIYIRGGTIDGNAANQTPWCGNNVGILMVDVANLTIEGVTIRNQGWVGLGVEGGTTVKILNNHVNNVQYHDGMFLTGSDFLIQGNTVDTTNDWGIVMGGGSSISATSGAVQFRAIGNQVRNTWGPGIGTWWGTDCLIEDNTISDLNQQGNGSPQTAIGICGGSGYGRSQSVTVTGNTLENIGQTGIVVEAADGTVISDNTITNLGANGIWVNGFYAPTGTVIDENTVTECDVGIRTSAPCTITGNTTERNASAGIAGLNTSQLTIRNNLVRDNGGAFAWGGDGISFTSVTHSLVEGNQVYDTGGDTQTYGIHEWNACDYNTYIGNYVTGSAAAYALVGPHDVLIIPEPSTIALLLVGVISALGLGAISALGYGRYRRRRV